LRSGAAILGASLLSHRLEACDTFPEALSPETIPERICGFSSSFAALHCPALEPSLPVLYATSARIGGSGLDAVALESLRTLHRARIDFRALAFENRPSEIPPAAVRSLHWHPVRMLSWLVAREYYYGAKKHALDRCAARELERGGYGLFHGWSGECVRSLRVARRKGVPSVIEIPTWHRHKGKTKSAALTRSERERAAAGGWAGFRNRLLVSRQQMLEEYDLADLILVLSQKAEETFLAAGVPAEKLFRHQRGVDVERFTPAEKPPDIFRAVFVGALIERKGVHHLLRAWKMLGLKNAELVLVGTVHDEIRPWLREYADDSVKLPGFVPRVETLYREAAVHVFPSSCEGSAKATYEAAACGLPQIATRESGDVVVDGVNGLVIPPDSPEAIADALSGLYANRDLAARMGAAGRERAVASLTWAHFGRRLLEAYRVVGNRGPG
jgi:glycosyltransferase involved in cell wall biosynthesis